MYSVRIAQAIQDHFNTHEIDYEFDSDKGVFSLDLPLESPISEFAFYIKVRESDFYTKSIIPICADIHQEKQMNDMARFIVGVNYQLVNGNFDLDLDDGEISFRTYADLEDMEITPDLISRAFLTPMVMFEKFIPGMIGVLYGGLDPKKAVEFCLEN